MAWGPLKRINGSLVPDHSGKYSIPKYVISLQLGLLLNVFLTFLHSKMVPCRLFPGTPAILLTHATSLGKPYGRQCAQCTPLLPANF